MMHSVAISEILKNPPSLDRKHLEWGAILAETAWSWYGCADETVLRDQNGLAVLRNTRFLTKERMKRIQSIWPWLIGDDLITALLGTTTPLRREQR